MVNRGSLKMSLKTIITIIIAIVLILIGLVLVWGGLNPLQESGASSMKNLSKNVTEVWPW